MASHPIYQELTQHTKCQILVNFTAAQVTTWLVGHNLARWFLVDPYVQPCGPTLSKFADSAKKYMIFWNIFATCFWISHIFFENDDESSYLPGVNSKHKIFLANFTLKSIIERFVWFDNLVRIVVRSLWWQRSFWTLIVLWLPLLFFGQRVCLVHVHCLHGPAARLFWVYWLGQCTRLYSKKTSSMGCIRQRAAYVNNSKIKKLVGVEHDSYIAMLQQTLCNSQTYKLWWNIVLYSQ